MTGPTEAEMIVRNRAEIKYWVDRANQSAEENRRLYLANWKMIKTWKNPDEPRPEPKDRYRIYLETATYPWAIGAVGGTVDFPDDPPLPSGVVSMLPDFYEIMLVDGTIGKIRLEARDDTMLDAMQVGQEILYDGKKYRKVQYRAAMTTGTAYGLVT